MNISCDIIKDILPLYAEDMVSSATREMMDGHLCECEGCSRALEALKKPQKLPAEVDVSALKRVGDSIRRRRILAVMAVFLFAATVLVGGAFVLDVTVNPINGQQIHADFLIYVAGLGAASLLCLVLGIYFRKKWYGELIRRFAAVSGSLAVSALIVAIGMPYSMLKEIIVDSIAIAIPMCLFILCICQLIKLNRQDKGL